MLRLLAAIVVAAAAVAAIFLGPTVLNTLSSSGTKAFPDPVFNQAVYDPAQAISPDVAAALEDQIDAIENRSGAEIVIYIRYDPTITQDANAADARRLIDQWGVGRAGYDDGLVILLTFRDTALQHGELNTYAGAGFLQAYLPLGAQAQLRDDVIIPAIQQGSLGGGLLAAMQVIDAAVTPAATARLDTFRVLNAIVGIPGAILALFLTLGSSWYAWSRYGNDPEEVDSPSILMAGPPASMTPALATVIRAGRATQQSINTLLVDLAGKGLIAFRNLDRVKKMKREDDPDPLVDPAIDVVSAADAHSKRLFPAEREAYTTVNDLAIGGILTRESLWRMNDALKPVRSTLESEAVRLGWLTQRPTPIITRWVVIGVVELLAAGLLVWLGYTIPMSGLTLAGAGLAVGGIGTTAFGSAMSQRTAQGAYVDSMLKAYRRTLKKTLEQSQSMGEVLTVPEVRLLADTPDKAVVWGIALGLHQEVAGILERELRNARQQGGASPVYYPTWLGSSGSSGFGSAATGGGLAGLFSASGTPDIGGMFSALGSVGSSPASSSSGGGFGGGGGSSF